MQSKKSGFAASISFALLTAWLTAFALPANAAKTITLSVAPATLSSQTTVVTATITNTGNANSNSFEVDWTTSPYFTVTGASAGGTTGTCSTGLTPGYSGCVFNRTLPTKTSITATLTVQVQDKCGPLSINWLGYAWTGSPASPSQSFTLTSAPPVTSWPSCSIKFVTQPKDAFIDSTITGSPLNSNGAPVSVQLLRNGVAAVGTAVTLGASSSCATGTITNATTDSTGTVNLVFTGAAASDSCQLTASASEYGSVSSLPFKVVVAQGKLGCSSGDNTFGATEPVSGLDFDGTRLPNVLYPSESGAACRQVPYVVSTTCPAGFTGTCTNFTYDPLDQGTRMAFAMHWVWPFEDIPALGIGHIDNTQQLFLNGNPMPLALDLCREIIPAYGTDGTFIGLEAGSPSPIDQESPTPAGTQAGCLVRRTVKQIGDQVQLTEDAYVQGDYAARRN